MDDMKGMRQEMEQRTRILKQLEGVYRTSTSVTQRRRVLKEIQEIKRVIKDLQKRFESAGMNPDTEGGDDMRGTGLSILGRIPVRPFRTGSKDREMDTVVSYMKFFENNYLPILSDYYIKLDYSHSGKRDTFYPGFMEAMHLLKQYEYEKDSASDNERQYDWLTLARDKTIVRKGRQRYLFGLDSYFKDLRSFIKLLVDDSRTEGAILLNPEDRIDLGEFEENRTLNNYTVEEAIQEIYAFVEEFIGFLAMPEL
jgi:hypothetical protein